MADNLIAVQTDINSGSPDFSRCHDAVKLDYLRDKYKNSPAELHEALLRHFGTTDEFDLSCGHETLTPEQSIEARMVALSNPTAAGANNVPAGAEIPKDETAADNVVTTGANNATPRCNKHTAQHHSNFATMAVARHEMMPMTDLNDGPKVASHIQGFKERFKNSVARKYVSLLQEYKKDRDQKAAESSQPVLLVDPTDTIPIHEMRDTSRWDIDVEDF